MRLLAVTALTLLAAGLPGCVQVDGAAGDACTLEGATATPKLHGLYMQTAPGSPWQTVVLAPSGALAVTGVDGWATPGWNTTLTTVSLPDERRFEIVSVHAGRTDGNAGVHLHLDAPGCPGQARTGIEWDLAAPREGVLAIPGQGVHVMTAGFLTDGTLFYTNMPEVDGDPRWNRTASYAWGGDDPLPVYVYDQDRSEQPAHWKSASANVLPNLPKTGVPQVDQNASLAAATALGAADSAAGVGYFTTITGFNAALKGLPTTSMHVAVIPPEQAYTRPGNEGHALYGQTLVFVIKVLDVVQSPCPAAVDARRCNEIPNVA